MYGPSNILRMYIYIKKKNDLYLREYFFKRFARRTLVQTVCKKFFLS